MIYLKNLRPHNRFRPWTPHIIHLTCMYHVHLSLCMRRWTSCALLVLVALSIINPYLFHENDSRIHVLSHLLYLLLHEFCWEVWSLKDIFYLVGRRKSCSSWSPYPQLGFKTSQNLSLQRLRPFRRKGMKNLTETGMYISSWGSMLILDISVESLNPHPRLHLPSVRDHELFFILLLHVW